VTAAACHQRLRMPYRLLGKLLGAHESTISLAARRVIPLLEAHGITPDDGGTRVATLAELRKHAATAGITLTTTATGQPAADHAKRRSPKHNTPKVKNRRVHARTFLTWIMVAYPKATASPSPAPHGSQALPVPRDHEGLWSL